MKLDEMKIYLLSDDSLMKKAWDGQFAGIKNVETACEEFCSFMVHTKVECVVSPANAYGLMDGGYDAAITEWFGERLQMKVRQIIADEFYGEQPVGTSVILDAGRDGVKLIHTPTMRYPDKIRDPLTVYTCTRTCLITALKNNIKSIVIPAFGGLTGRLSPQTIAEMMKRAYDQLADPPAYIGWRYAKSQFFKY